MFVQNHFQRNHIHRHLKHNSPANHQINKQKVAESKRIRPQKHSNDSDESSFPRKVVEVKKQLPAIEREFSFDRESVISFSPTTIEPKVSKEEEETSHKRSLIEFVKTSRLFVIYQSIVEKVGRQKVFNNFLALFLKSFIIYQLETWKLLTRSAICESNKMYQLNATSIMENSNHFQHPHRHHHKHYSSGQSLINNFMTNISDEQASYSVTPSTSSSRHLARNISQPQAYNYSNVLDKSNNLSNYYRKEKFINNQNSYSNSFDCNTSAIYGPPDQLSFSSLKFKHPNEIKNYHPPDLGESFKENCRTNISNARGEELSEIPLINHSSSSLCFKSVNTQNQNRNQKLLTNSNKNNSLDQLNYTLNGKHFFLKQSVQSEQNVSMKTKQSSLKSLSVTCGDNLNQNQRNAAINSKKVSGISPGKLSLAGAKKRFGFKQKNLGLHSLSVQRSEEIFPFEARFLTRESTFTSLSDSGNESGSNQSPDPRSCFVEGLGIGQIASRQALVSPYLGDIQLTINDRRGMLEVEIVRARQLQIKAGAKLLPSPYVKVYLMKSKKCLAKFKTNIITRTLNPIYQQRFIFREDYADCVLQVIVWGDYGKKDRKCLMGIVQVHLDDLDISNLVISWYRLFNAPSMASSVQSSSKALRHSIILSNK